MHVIPSNEYFNNFVQQIGIFAGYCYFIFVRSGEQIVPSNLNSVRSMVSYNAAEVSALFLHDQPWTLNNFCKLLTTVT